MELEFRGGLWFWKGPSPWYFVTVPDDACAALEHVAGLVSYGWGMVPVEARIGSTAWTTSLFPKDGRYLLPVKAGVRKAQRLVEGEQVAVHLTVRL